MSFWMRIFCVMAAADLVVWWVVWRTLGRSPHAWKWACAALHLFFATMLAGLAVVMLGREFHWNTDAALPRFVTVALFIWHMLVVPLTLAGIIIAAIWALVKMAVRLFHRPAN